MKSSLHWKKVFERLDTDRFDNSCNKDEEFELQVEDIIPYHNIEESSSSDTSVDSHVNQQDVSSSGRDRPNTCSASDSETKACTAIAQLKARNATVRRKISGSWCRKSLCCKRVFRDFRANVLLQIDQCEEPL